MYTLVFRPGRQREAAEGESKNVSEAKKRVAENESSATMAEANYRAEAHVGVGRFGLQVTWSQRSSHHLVQKSVTLMREGVGPFVP